MSTSRVALSARSPACYAGRLMTKLSCIALAAAGLAGCGSGDKGKLEGFKDRMCACTDKDCIKKVNDDLDGCMKSVADKYKDKDPPKELEDVLDGIDKCEKDAKKAIRDKD